MKRVIDGDSLVADISVGLGVVLAGEHCRMLGINAPEMLSSDPAERERAVAAQGRLGILVLIDRDVTLDVERRDKYGRRLVTVYVDDDPESVNARLVREGYAVAYDGGKR